MRDKDGKIIMLMAMVTDDLIMAGSVRLMTHFSSQFRSHFEVRQVIIENTFNRNGHEVYQDPSGDVIMSMENYARNINFIPISAKQKKKIGT